MKLVYRAWPKFREHMNPEKHPIPVVEELPDTRTVKKLDRIEADRGLKIEYRKPKWKID